MRKLVALYNMVNNNISKYDNKLKQKEQKDEKFFRYLRQKFVSVQNVLVRTHAHGVWAGGF